MDLDDLDAQLARAMAPLPTGGADVSVSAAVPDCDDDGHSGPSAGYRDSVAYDTASIVKVSILAALLLLAQDEGRELSGEEHAYAVAMIGHSDNAAATKLLRTIGGAEGLDAANGRLGLTGTSAAHAWGLTQTTARDQLRLLQAVFGTDSELSEDSRIYVRELMERVVAGQQWGVSAAGSGWALKNGWMPRTTTGLWDINSIGRVHAGGRMCLVAVLSRGHATREAGIAVVEAVAKAAVGVLDGVSGAR